MRHANTLSRFWRARTAVLAAATLLSVSAACAPALAAGRVSVATFAIHHQSQGEIGTQTLRIERDGDRTVVDVRLNIVVRVLGVVVHRQEQTQKEVWRNGRLMSFDALDVENSRRATVSGRADGDKFVIVTKTGQRIEAPASIRTTYPWSPEIAKHKLLMGTGSGELNNVRIALVATTSLTLDGSAVPAVHYRVTGDFQRDLWFAPDGELLQFQFKNDGDAVTFRRKR